MKKIGIMGGTFDPIHYGHLVTAQAALREFVLDKVIFIPSGSPPHKKDEKHSDAEDRAKMTKLAISSNPHFELSRIELERKGHSYSVDTVRAMLELYGNDTEIYFITGADAILDIATWMKADELLGLCKFIAATRPSFNLVGLASLPKHWQAQIKPMQIPALAISSTDIRNRIANNRPIKYLLPEVVEEYILDKGLYQK